MSIISATQMVKSTVPNPITVLNTVWKIPEVQKADLLHPNPIISPNIHTTEELQHSADLDIRLNKYFQKQNAAHESNCMRENV